MMELTTSAENMTMHGFARISITRSKIIRTIWLISMLGFSGMLFYQLQAILVRFFKYPSVVKYETILSTKLQFPSVTICASSISKPKLLALGNKTFIEESFERVQKYHNVGMGRIEFASTILNKVIKNVTNLKQASFNQSSFMIENLKGSCNFGTTNECNYSKDFKDILLVNRVPCYNFNHNGKFYQKRAGPEGGFSIILFLDVNNAMPLPFAELGDGVEILLQHHTNFPFPWKGSILVPAGHLSYIEIKKTEILRMKYPYPSNCTNGENLPLLYPGQYTVLNCQESCFGYKVAENCSKVDFYLNALLPKHLKKKLAITTSDHECWFKIFHKMDSEGFQSCKCKLPCSEVHFDKSVTHSKWPSTPDIPYYRSVFSKALGINKSTLTEEFIRKNFLKVNVFFGDMSLKRTTEEKKYTYDMIISDIGGQMGIWIGASMFSIMELFYLFAQFVNHIFKPKMKTSHVGTLENGNNSHL